MRLSRQQRRALEREKFKSNKKKISNQIEIVKKIGGNTKLLEMAEWVQNLNDKETEYCNTLCIEHTKAHINNFSVAFQEVVENLLIDEGYANHEEIMIQITDELEDTVIKVSKIEDEGENYYMSLNQDRNKIIEYYKEKINEGWNEKEALKETMTMFKKYSKSSVKNVIRTNCASNACPLKNKDGNCGNKVVTEEKERCANYEKRKNNNEEKMNNEEKAKIFFDKNKGKEKKEVITECAAMLGIKESSIDRYYFNWKKENNIKEKVTASSTEAVPEVNKEEIKEEKKMGFKVLKKVVVLDLEGQCGKYHVEGNKVITSKGTFTSVESANEAYKAEEEELIKKLEEVKKTKEELKQVIREYVEI